MTIKLIGHDSMSQVEAVASYHVSNTFNMPKSLYAGIAAYDAEGVMLGYILLYPETPNIYSIPSLAVRQGCENKGIMKALFNSLFTRMPATYWLEVHPANERARKLYESLGFTFVESNATYTDGVCALLGEVNK